MQYLSSSLDKCKHNGTLSNRMSSHYGPAPLVADDKNFMYAAEIQRLSDPLLPMCHQQSSRVYELLYSGFVFIAR